MHSINKKLENDASNWISVEFPPKIQYELVFIKDSQGSISTGWWTGDDWDGKIDTLLDVVEWKPFIKRREKDHD